MTLFGAQQKILAEVRGLLSEMDLDVQASSPVYWRTIKGEQASAKSKLSELWDSVKTDIGTVAIGAPWLESALDPRAYALIPALASLPLLPKLYDVFMTLELSVAEQYADAQSLGAMANDHEVSADHYNTALSLYTKLLTRAGIYKQSQGLSQWTENHPTKIEGMSIVDLASWPGIEREDVQVDVDGLEECLESCAKLCAEAYIQYAQTYGQAPPQLDEVVGEEAVETGDKHLSEKAKGKRPLQG